MLGAFAFNIFNIIRHLAEGNITNYFLPFADINNIIGFAFLAILSTIVATAMNNYALGRLQISTAAAFGGVSTLTTILIGVFFKNEALYYYHFIGLSLIFLRMFGVTYLAAKRTKE